MSTSKYHERDMVEVDSPSGKKTVKRTSVCYKPKEKKTPHGTAVICHEGVYKKEESGQLTRIDRKPKLGKAGRKAEKRAKQLARNSQ